MFLQLYHEYSKSILSISKKKRNLIFSIFLGLYDTYSSMRFQSRPVNDSSHKECRLNSLLNKKKLKKERKKERKRKKEEEAVIRNRINRSFNLSNTSWVNDTRQIKVTSARWPWSNGRHNSERYAISLGSPEHRWRGEDGVPD